MSEIITPRVFLVSSTMMEDLESYLIAIGSPDWKMTDDIGTMLASDAETICEAAGRMCYRSWEPYNEAKPDATNPNVARVRSGNHNYIGNILKVGHGCYDIETEVLTQNGWKKWTNVLSTDKLASLHLGTKTLSYQQPTRLIRYHHKGKMYKITGRGVDLLVTPDHKMVACKTGTKEGRKRDSFELYRAYDLDDSSYVCLKNVENYYDGIITEDKKIIGLHKLLGFAIGDGNLEGSRLSFHLKRERKIQYLRKICAEAGVHLTESSDRYTITLHAQTMKLFASMYDGSKDKIIPGILCNYPTDLCFAIYDGLINSDGSISDTGTQYDTTSETLAGQLQELCLRIGYSSNISQAACNDRGDERKTLYRSHIITRENKPEVNKVKSSVTRSSWVDFDGEVFCAEVQDHTLYVRRNGKPIWSGNSVLEHANIGFIIKDGSRVFTHEQVRHRAGVAYSQESLRFVRLTTLKYYLPTCIAENEEARQLFHEAFNQMEQWQEKLERIFAKDLAPEAPFSRKKELTSAFRRIAPDGLATSIMVTANVRAIRHMIAMRTSPHAEEEIRLIYGQIADICQQRWPNFFQDMTNDNGHFKFTNEKV